MITIYESNSMANAAKYVMDVIKRVDKTNLSITHTVIVPDRASLEAERALLKAIGGSFNAQVKTFRRLASDILPKYDYLSKQAGVMALSMIIKENKANLTCYVKGVETPGFVEDMYDVISMMKYCKISPKDLMKAELPKSVAGKARDIALLYQAYCDYTEGRFIDSADKLDLLCEEIATTDVAANGYYYLYDFDNFTAQELSIIEQLALKSRGVTVACCVGNGARDRHLYLDDIYQGIINICKRNNLTPNTVKGKRDYPHEYARQIGENLYRYDDKIPTPGGDFVEIFEGSTRVNEVYALACRIQKHVRAGGRFKDVYVVTSDVDKYSNAISMVFSQFEIPYFCDRQFVLSDHPYARFVIDYLTLYRNNAKLSFVLPFVKNYLFCGNFDGKKPSDDVFLFENYCLKYNVNYSYKGFNLGKDEPFYSQADAFRQRFYELYRSNHVPDGATVNEYLTVIRNLIDYAKLADKNASFATQQRDMGLEFEAKVTSQAQEKLESVLLQAANVMGDKFVKLDEFIKLFTAGVASVKVSVIPVYNDCVVFANMAKARKHDIKFLALLGANQGAMPIVKNDCKLLSDRNIEELVRAGINVEPRIQVENKRERFSLFQLLLEPTEKLYVSYTTADGADSLLPSPFIAEFAELFQIGNAPLRPSSVTDDGVYTKKQAIEKLVLYDRRVKDKQAATLPLYEFLREKYKNEAKKYAFNKDGKAVMVERGGELYLKKSATSVSQLTTFFKCPYSFYFHYGLNVQPRPIAELKSADLGTILHFVLEKYVKNIDLDEDDANTREKAYEWFEKALSEDFYKGMRTDRQMEGVLMQLKAEAARMCKVTKQQLRNSEFKNYAAELNFGSETRPSDGKIDDGDETENAKSLPAVVVAFDGGEFYLKGVVDRVDVLPAKDKTKDNLFIVVDYKSGAEAASYSEKYLYDGQKMQLLVYVKAVKDSLKLDSGNGKMRPAGFYYFNMHDNFTDLNENVVYTYNGRTLDDVDVARAIDTSWSSGKSEKLSLRLTKDNAVHKQDRDNKMLTAEQFDNQTEYAYKLIARAGELMHKGYAAVNPFEKMCEFCDYRSICDFGDVYTHEPRDLKNVVVDKTTIDKTVKK
ncbi:MAG: PD-(D/E)XK nuclease family protein [Clostridiales bacterium]|nr:PD-(D/E)XK nuclease family protein [Clostridiales bacterium]